MNEWSFYQQQDHEHTRVDSLCVFAFFGGPNTTYAVPYVDWCDDIFKWLSKWVVNNHEDFSKYSVSLSSTLMVELHLPCALDESMRLVLAIKDECKWHVLFPSGGIKNLSLIYHIYF